MARYSAAAYRMHTDAHAKPFGGAMFAGYTTKLDFNGRSAEGLGPLSYEARRGMYLHPTLAVTPERLPLGVIDAWMRAREAQNEQGERPGISESARWIEGYERIAERALELPDTRLVYVADREGGHFGADAAGPYAESRGRRVDSRQAQPEIAGRYR